MFPPLHAWISMNSCLPTLDMQFIRDMLTIGISCWIFASPFLEFSKSLPSKFPTLYRYMWEVIDSSILITLNNCFLLIMHSTCMVNTSIFGIPSRSRQQQSWFLKLLFLLPTTSFSLHHSMSPEFSEPLVLFTPGVQPSTTSPMSSLDEQLAQAVAAITMLSNSMVAMQQQVAILTQNVYKQQQRMLQSVIPTPLSPLNIPLPPSPPSSLCHSSPYLQGQYAFPPPIRQKEPKIVAPLHFTGKCDKTESFINLCTLYMNGQKSEFPDEDAKI